VLPDVTMVEEACGKVVRECLGVRAGEVVLIVRDHEQGQRLHPGLVAATRQAGGVPIVVSLPSCRSAEEVPRAARAALEAADAVLVCTPWILPHEVRRQALTAGTWRGGIWRWRLR